MNCPICKRTYTDEIDIFVIKEIGMCTGCEKIVSEASNDRFDLDEDYQDLSI